LAARANGIAFDDPRLMAAALAVGADVPVCLDSRARIMRGVGELLSEPIDLPVLPAVLVNPRVALATREVFSRFTGSQSRNGIADVPREFGALIEFLKQHDNDLTPAASACAPVVGEMLRALQSLPRVKLARMSGSGPTCFALFCSQADAIAAAQKLGDQQSNWWIQPATIGSASTRP
ncbi:MAG: 4-(cytidine 5'-diphospho)-2-C-methyl-D-erythritol kinase, partial [Pseudolabrys sp.]